MDHQLNRQHNYNELHAMRQSIWHFDHMHLYMDLDTSHSCTINYSGNRSWFRIVVDNMVECLDNQANKHTMDYYWQPCTWNIDHMDLECTD